MYALHVREKQLGSTPMMIRRFYVCLLMPDILVIRHELYCAQLGQKLQWSECQLA